MRSALPSLPKLLVGLNLIFLGYISPAASSVAPFMSRGLSRASCTAFVSLASPATRSATRLPALASPLRVALRASMSSETDSKVVADNLGVIKARVEAAAKAASLTFTPRLVAVSKTKPVEMLMEAYEAGQRHFGENYVNELIEKAPKMPSDIKWHFIGHLQSNKAKTIVAAVPNLFVVETVDSAKIADKLSSAVVGAKRSEPLEVYIQVDTSGEDTKSGVTAEEAPGLATHIKANCPGLKLAGVMTIGAPNDMAAFDRLVAAREAVAATVGVEPSSLELSMGMSGDFEDAISRGSTNVRVGSSIFGERLYKK